MKAHHSNNRNAAFLFLSNPKTTRASDTGIDNVCNVSISAASLLDAEYNSREPTDLRARARADLIYDRARRRLISDTRYASAKYTGFG